MRLATEDTVLDICRAFCPRRRRQEALLAAAVGEAANEGESDRDRVRWRLRPPRRAAAVFKIKRWGGYGDEDELRAALDAPWDDWAVFLHPVPAGSYVRSATSTALSRIIGSAGTGKDSGRAAPAQVRLAAEAARAQRVADHPLLTNSPPGCRTS